MEYNQEQLELVEHYLDGQLSEIAKKDFELRLEKDEEFQKFFREISLIIEGVKSSARNELEQKLRTTESQLENADRVKVVPIRKYRLLLSVAAGLALLISLSVFFGKWKTEKNMQEYLALAMEPYDNIIYPAQRSQKNKLSTEELAYFYYNAQQYRTAIQIFSTLELTAKQKQNADFYLANAYMAEENYEKAIELFNNLLNENTIFENQARWYQSLCLLKTGEEESAIEQLQLLTQTNNSYKTKTENLLEKLK